ncbi:MAG: tRNA uridine-5-carboxymethylaminomethyl(34) synthesis enzyme MnmG [Planctomycetes bacterium]|nr:tRNA uridine-5-carboxymethylaminomethyl(34) synthesis enzyme MnmG [Planctomycetota bacterium]
MTKTQDRYDVVVVGGGHAGAEAAAAASRLGARAALVTLDPVAVGRMSCNPSIGGLAKGQIVREVDALGGIMGKAADRAGIHFRLLNASKGPAVQSPRCQCDRELYATAVRDLIGEAGVEVIAGEVTDLVVEGDRVTGAELADGSILLSRAVVLTTGTFLGGVLWVGEERTEGGRLGERGAHRLADRLAARGFRLGRMKTGTPPRFHTDSIDWSQTVPQPSDANPVTFSFLQQAIPERKVDCAVARTGPATHDVIRAHLDRSPMFTGGITGPGPRYCPSIEDKVFRFPAKDSHQIWLEPEGLDSDLVYPNGISTSLPADAQEAFVRTIPALANVRFSAHGYAVEYTHVDPTECGPTLEAVRLQGLFLAGQINGTTGYEEAAGQGLVAGINAARRAGGGEPFILGRHEAYIGVLVDDLVTRGVTEPYRMFTSLAEHRLLLRHHDADVRLWPRAESVGLLEPEQARATAARVARRSAARRALESARVGSGTAMDAMRRPDFGWAEAATAAPELAALTLDVRDREELLIEAQYSGYVAREQLLIDRRAGAEGTRLPVDLPYADIPHLRAEAKEKLLRICPASVGQASRISGIGSSDISALLIWLRVEQAAP